MRKKFPYTVSVLSNGKWHFKGKTDWLLGADFLGTNKTKVGDIVRIKKNDNVIRTGKVIIGGVSPYTGKKYKKVKWDD